MLANEKNSLTLSILKKMRQQGAPDSTIQLAGADEDHDQDQDQDEPDEEPDQSGTVTATAGSNAMIRKARKKLDSK